MTQDSTEFIYTDETSEDLDDQTEHSDQFILPSKNYFGMLLITQLVIFLISVTAGFFSKNFWWQKLFIRTELLYAPVIAALLVGVSSIFFLLRKKIRFTNIEWLVEKIYIPVFGLMTPLQMLFISLFAGFAEEALFRGVLMPFAGLFWSSVIFGLLHMGTKKLVFSGIWIMIIGGLLGWLYMYSGNLMIPITVHFLNNLFSFMILRKYMKKIS